MTRAASAVVALIALFSNQELPDRETFLRDARAALARSQQIVHKYAYKERRTDVHVNPFGRMGTGGTRVVQVYPSANPQLTFKQVIQRNGVPVPRAELQQQEADYRARVAQLQRRQADEDADDRLEREREDLIARRRADMMIADVVGTLQFELVRREVRHGVPTIVLSFSGRPDARPMTRQGRVAKVFKGHAWVHEASHEVVHVEAVATDDVSFGGFIAKLYEGTHATLERQEIDRGVWMPTRVNLTGDVRALFRRTKIDYSVEWFDYQPMAALSLPHTGIKQ
jgi:hypothetical protein